MDDFWSDCRFGLYHKIRNEKKLRNKLKPKKNKSRKDRPAQIAARGKMFEADPKCHWCGRELTKENCSLEHITPMSEGGDNSDDNLALACRRYNSSRATGGVPCVQHDGQWFPEDAGDVREEASD